TKLFTLESSVYRVSDQMEDLKNKLQSQGESYSVAINQAAEEYAIECSVLKVFGSEVLDYVVDENVQIHGGIGFSEEFGAARAYRDARINRIFEGTNEINRLLIVDMLLKRALQGKIDLVGPAWEVQKELASMPAFETLEGQFAQEHKAVKDFKKIILMVAGAAVKMQMDGKLNLEQEQELLMNVADLIIDAYAAESLLLRVEKLQVTGKAKLDMKVYEAMLSTFINDATHRMVKNGTDALCAFADGDLLKTLLMGLKRYSKYPPVNVKEKRRIIADALIAHNEWCF
ncbi:MAG TPA: acyl-CoA dehydrogenase family protein, partial [Saprospiraceae bacterium]|nr:acyl-CoA dehydrogenase family protein [Saprospiraceae bacterium]